MNQESKKVLGVLGKPGAGKDTFCKIFQDNYPSVAIVKFSTPLTEILEMFFEEAKREDQQWLANQLRNKFGGGILAKAVKKKIKNSHQEFILVNGVRVEKDAQMIEEVGGKLVYLDTKPKKRWKRMQDRDEKDDDNVTYEKFLQLDQAKPEKEIKKIGEKADITITNNGTKKELKKSIQELIKELYE